MLDDGTFGETENASTVDADFIPDADLSEPNVIERIALRGIVRRDYSPALPSHKISLSGHQLPFAPGASLSVSDFLS